jgi:hypothetical protein
LQTFWTHNRAEQIRFGAIFVLALLAYALMAGATLTKQSIAPHFVYLADAWLDGRSSLAEPLPSTYDLISYEGQFYVAQPPLPALMMLPLVAIRGAAGTPDILVTVILGALSVALADLTLRVMVRDLSPQRHFLLMIFFALGTVHGMLSALGTVWFTPQIAATLALWFFLLGMVWRWPLLVGCALAAVALARPGVLPGAILLYAGWILFDFWAVTSDANSHNREGLVTLPYDLLRLLKTGLLAAAPILLALVFLGWYNNARFASATDFGYDYINEAPELAQRRLDHGNFAAYFLPENLYTATIRPPLLEDGSIEPDPWGMGLLLTSPVLVYAALAFPWDRQKMLLASGGMLMLLPALLYHNTGSAQFGYRFVLDALPVLMILVAIGARRGKGWPLAVLTVWSVAVHLWGFFWLFEMFNGRGWWLF